MLRRQRTCDDNTYFVSSLSPPCKRSKLSSLYIFVLASSGHIHTSSLYLYGFRISIGLVFISTFVTVMSRFYHRVKQFMKHLIRTFVSSNTSNINIVRVTCIAKREALFCFTNTDVNNKISILAIAGIDVVAGELPSWTYRLHGVKTSGVPRKIRNLD